VAHSQGGQAVNQEEQRIAIAEACGWKTGYRDPEAWHPLPDYLNDLNAMHDAEKVLNEKQEDIMNSTLWDIMDGRKYLWHATASQRAEAFLRTIGKWKEAKP
jgi:hypothetical protein